MFISGSRATRERLMCSAALVAFTLCSTAAAAQTASGSGIETITVTAEKRSENIQSVPMSITAFDGQQLEQNNITDMEDLSRFVPSLTINQANNNRNSTIIIRNIGTSGTNPGTDPDVGVFIDGVFVPVAGPIYNELTDIATVEVLRGPQGTLYGRNTAVGAVNITTRAPSQDTEAMVDVQYGNFDERRLMGYFGGGISDALAGRLSLWSDTHSGYEKNLYTNSSVNNSDQYGGRGRLRWQPDSDTTVDLIAYYAKTHTNGTYATQVDPTGPGGILNGYAPGSGANFIAASKRANPLHPYVVPGDWQVDAANPADDTSQNWGTSMSATRSLPFDATVTDILAYNSFVDDIRSQSTGYLPQDISSFPQLDKVKSASNELRIASSGEHFLDYIGGVYLYQQNTDYNAVLTMDPGANRVFPAVVNPVSNAAPAGPVSVGDRQSEQYSGKTNAAAVYGQVTAHITDTLRLLGGLRYSADHKSATINFVDTNVLTGTPSKQFVNSVGPNSSNKGKFTDHSLTWMYGAQYDVVKDVMAYVTVSSGFKDGGFNSRSANPFSFDPETSLNYEVGAKTAWFDNKLVLNADVYRMLIFGFQTSTLNPSGNGFVIGNAGDIREQGVEADAQAHPFEQLTLNGDLSYTDSKILRGAEHLTCDTTYPFAGSLPPPTSGPISTPPVPATKTTAAIAPSCNFDGLTTAYSPKWKWSVGGRWEQPWRDTPYNWYVSGDVTYQSSDYLDGSLDPRSFQKGYALVDVSLGVEPTSGNWRVDLWAKNLTNKMYYVAEAPLGQAAYVSASGTATGTLAANGYMGWYGRPRTYGIEASYKF